MLIKNYSDIVVVSHKQLPERSCYETTNNDDIRVLIYKGVNYSMPVIENDDEVNFLPAIPLDTGVSLVTEYETHYEIQGGGILEIINLLFSQGREIQVLCQGVVNAFINKAKGRSISVRRIPILKPLASIDFIGDITDEEIEALNTEIKSRVTMILTDGAINHEMIFNKCLGEDVRYSLSLDNNNLSSLI